MRRLRFLVERVLLLESDEWLGVSGEVSLSRKLDRTAVMIEMHVVGGCRCFFLARPFRIRFIRNMTLGWEKGFDEILNRCRLNQS